MVNGLAAGSMIKNRIKKSSLKEETFYNYFIVLNNDSRFDNLQEHQDQLGDQEASVSDGGRKCGRRWWEGA